MKPEALESSSPTEADMVLEASPVRPVGSWRSLVDGVDAIVWEAEPSTLRFTYVSRGAERVLGYPVRKWLDEPDFWPGILHPEDREGALEYCRGMTKAGRDHRLEYRARRADGAFLWLRDLVTVVVGEDGAPALLRGAMVDVTDIRRQLETLGKEIEALGKEEGRHRLLEEHNRDLVSLHSSDGRFLYASPACREVVGYEPEELVGSTLERVIHPEDLPLVQASINEVLEGKVPPAVVFRAIRKDGSLRWCETKGRPSGPPHEDGEVRLVGVTRDISERRHLQAELERAQRLEAMGRLAGGVAHDFSNLLTVIQGHLAFFREGLRDDPELSGDLDGMSRAVDRAGALTRQLLTFGRRDFARPRSLDLTEAIRSVEELLDRVIPQNIALETGLSAGSLITRMDPIHLEQVLVNLAINARDAMPDGGRLTIELESRWVGEDELERIPGIEAGEYALIRVADTGYGMAPATLARIFDPFFTTKESERSTGLGLAIVYGIVRQSGGQIQVESEEGVGTTFRVWLPLA